jgi:hypothetical protein
VAYSVLVATCPTMNASSCERKLGSSAEITPSPPVSPGAAAVTPASSESRAALILPRASSSGAQLARGSASSAAHCSSTVAALSLTLHTGRLGRCGCTFGAALRTALLSHRSSSIMRTIARASVASPVGRYGVAKNSVLSAITASLAPVTVAP